MIRNYIIAMSLLSTSCMTTGHRSDIASVNEIILNPDFYINREVVVSGFLSFGDDRKNLWQSEILYSRAVENESEISELNRSYCISILTRNNEHYYSLSDADKSDVELRGTIIALDMDGAINLGFCNRLALVDPEVLMSR